MTIEKASKLFKLLGDKTRLIIVQMLYKENEICACKFMDFVDCGQPTLSHHLSILKENKLINSRKEGKKILYSCNKDLIMELLEILK